MHLEKGFANTFVFKWHFKSRVQSEDAQEEEKHSILTEFVLIMNGCFIQYNAPLVEYIDLAQYMKSFCQEWLDFVNFRSTSLSLSTMCFGNGTLQYLTGLYQSGSLHTLFSYHCKLSILGKILLLWNQSFHCLAIVAFQPQLVQVFRQKFSEL